MCRNFFYPYSFHVQFNPISLSKNNNQTSPSADAMGIIKKNLGNKADNFYFSRWNKSIIFRTNTNFWIATSIIHYD